MNARETADRHAGYVTAGNPQAAGADFTPEALQEFMQLGVRPPRGANKYEIANESDEGDRYSCDITYSNDQESQTLRSTWSKVGDDWKIVGIAKG